MKNKNKSIVVVGAGIVGVSTALWLQKQGEEVILIDSSQPGTGASFGNAGLLAQWAMVPVNVPELWKSAPKYLLNKSSPVFMRWSYFPKLFPWLAKFMANATENRSNKIIENLTPLVQDAVDQHQNLVKGTQAAKWLRDSKFSYVYRTHEAFKADSFGWKIKSNLGFIPNLVLGDDVREEEPILSPDIRCMAVLEGQGHITNPLGYVTELFKVFQKNGGKFINKAVKNFNIIHDQIHSVQLEDEEILCQKAVVTSGIWSKSLIKNLKINVPLETERGYHVIYEKPSVQPRNPMMITEGKFGVTPMTTGLRCAGTVELGGLNASASKKPIDFIKKISLKTFPELKFEKTSEWMGFRPTLPDSLPMIGEIQNTGIFTGFGHQHIGMTSGPKTGFILSQLVTDKKPNLDISGFSPERFN
jgi:D-amino-acid dehydrogenase